MSSKNITPTQLSRPYLGQKQKILMALSGGIDSFVSAHLLMLQNVELVAATVLSGTTKLPHGADYSLSCHVNPKKLKLIKDFCQRYSLPLHLIEAGSEFEEKVVQKWIGDRMMGRKSLACHSCHDLRIHLIYKKMLEIGADKFATGHFAKTMLHSCSGTYSIYRSNDKKNDQSQLLATLEDEILSKIFLPLSDLSKKEVLKLGENFGLESIKSYSDFGKCFRENDLKQKITKTVPASLRAKGNIISIDGSVSYGEYSDINHYYIGNKLPNLPQGTGQNLVVVGFNHKKRIILAAEEKLLTRKFFQLINCSFAQGLIPFAPMKAFIVFPQDLVLECWIHQKTLSCVGVELLLAHKLPVQEIVHVQNKNDKNAKILLTGEIQMPPLHLIDEYKSVNSDESETR